MSLLYQNCGLLSEIEGYFLTEAMAQISDKLKETYANDFEAHLDREIFDLELKANWQLVLKAMKLEHLNIGIERQIENFLDGIYVSSSKAHWLHWYAVFDVILSYYLSFKLENAPEFKIIEQYFNFFRESIIERGFLESIPEQLRLAPYERFTEQAEKQAEREKRPNCPKCGASHTLSHNNLRWLCGDCGKTWNKESPPEVQKSSDN